MSPWHLAGAGVIMCLGGLGQSVVGFGFALFATPLLVWSGVPLTDTVAMVAACSAIQSALGAFHLRAETPWRLSLTAVAVRLGGVVAGILVLKRLALLTPARADFAIGLILCGLVTLQFLLRPKPVARLHPGWGALAFAASGLLAGICGMGGPPLVLWAMAHDWTASKTRGFLFSVFAVSIPIQIVLLVAAFGVRILGSVALGAAFFPLVYLGTAVGMPIGNRMAAGRLRNAAYLVLLVIGIRAVVSHLVAALR